MDSGRWKLVTSIDHLVLITRVDENLRIVEERRDRASFAACAALSSERTEVVPTAITRLPRAFAASTASTTSPAALRHIRVHGVLLNAVDAHRLEGARAHAG
ncbi:hypothetical protein MJ584_06310 [Klebsiella pneumoniae]|nr:hypothetical protein MJ584_06310 [Klebsiella pneumoniae]